MNAVVDIKKGLEGVVVDSTSISLVDGEAGRLYYRGHPIEKLVKKPFAAVAHLVVFGELPDATQLREFEDFLWEAGRLPNALADSLAQLSRLHGHPMATLQAAMPLMAVEAPARRAGRTDDEQESLVVAARLPTAHALLVALRAGRTPTPILRFVAMASASSRCCITAFPPTSRSIFSSRPKFCKSITASMRAPSRRAWSHPLYPPCLGLGGRDGFALRTIARRRRSRGIGDGGRSRRPCGGG